ncbi:MAG: GFA family protein, partial [Congregibacter sp.]
MKVNGGCFCGELRYEAQIDPGKTGICHCRDCQRFSGSAFRTIAVVRPEQFAFTSGDPSFFEKTGASAGVRKTAFCGACGSHICSLPGDGSADVVSLRFITADNVGDLTPKME